MFICNFTNQYRLKLYRCSTQLRSEHVSLTNFDCMKFTNHKLSIVISSINIYLWPTHFLLKEIYTLSKISCYRLPAHVWTGFGTSGYWPSYIPLNSYSTIDFVKEIAENEKRRRIKLQCMVDDSDWCYFLGQYQYANYWYRKARIQNCYSLNKVLAPLRDEGVLINYNHAKLCHSHFAGLWTKWQAYSILPN